VTVVSYNIRAAIGPGPFPPAWWRHVSRERMQRIGAVIRALGPDVVALQEVALATVDGVVMDQPADLAALTGMEARYAAVGHFPVVDAETGRAIGASMWGNAILSRFPIRRSWTLALPISADDDLVEPIGSANELRGVRYADAPVGVRELRCALLCELETPAGIVMAVSAHLTHVGSGQRALQAAALAAEISRVQGTIVLAADLNASIESQDLASLRNVLHDAFAAAGIVPGDPARMSCGTDAIDHVLTRGLQTRSCRVVREAGDASDHWPLIAELMLSG
jgi:endonuclease/exonuclease/phosphatase family metal-dependent hydrolase